MGGTSKETAMEAMGVGLLAPSKRREGKGQGLERLSGMSRARESVKETEHN